MRVLLLATEIGRHGGIQRYGQRIAEALPSDTFDVSAVETARSPGAGGKATAVVRAIRSLGRPGGVVWVLHPRLAPLAVPLARMARHRVVVSTYGFENWMPYPRGWREAMQRADVVTAISKFSTALMGRPGRKAVLLRPTWGIDATGGDPLPQQARRTTVAFVGRLDDRYKGLDTFVGLAGRFSGERWTFEAAGAGVVPSFAASAGGVRVTADASDAFLVDLYRRAAAVVLPSRVERTAGGRFRGGEGFGIVLLEAARAGAVVVASDEGACPETLALLGNGVACGPTVGATESALRSLLDDEDRREALARAGRRSADHLSPARFGESVRALLATATAHS